MTVYSDISSPYCSNATLASSGICTNTTIHSYTVDCAVDGFNAGNYTTIYPSSSETSGPSATPPATLSSATEPTPLPSTSSPSSSLAPSSSSQTSSVSSIGPTPPSPSPTQAPRQGDGDGGLSRGGEIGLGIGLGLLTILLIGVGIHVARKRYRKRRAAQSGSTKGVASVSELNKQPSPIRRSESGGPSNGENRQSDEFSCANSSFPSLPSEPQPML